MAVSLPAEVLRAAGRRMGLASASASDGRARLKLTPGWLELSTSGAESTLTVSVPVHSDEEWEAIVHGGVLTSFLSIVDAEAIELSLGSQLHLRSESGEVDLPCAPLDSWHAIEHETVARVVWDAGALEQVRRVTHAAAIKEVGRAISGVCFVDGKAVATDTYQLAAVDVSAGFDKAIVVPADALAIAGKLHDGMSSLSVCTSDKRITFEGDGWRFTSTLIVDTFPQWRRFVPELAEPTLVSSRADLLDALRKMRVVAGKALSHKVSLEPLDQARIRIWSESPDVGRHEERFNGTFGLERAAFDLDRLALAIEHLNIEAVELEMADPRAAAVVRSPDYLATVMPMRA